MPFCTVADVSAITQPNPEYSATTKPTLAQVQRLVEFISSEMELAIIKAGYTLPITDAKALTFLALTGSYGAGSLAKQANAQIGNPDVPNIAEDLWSKYKTNMESIRTGTSPLGGSSSAGVIANVPRSLATSRTVDGTDENYSDNTPWITRDTQF